MEKENYKIIGLYYTKSIVRPDSNGGIIFGRTGVTIQVGELDNFGIGLMKVEKIEYDTKLKAFKVLFPKGGVKVIPYREDVEVMYQQVKEDK